VTSRRSIIVRSTTAFLAAAVALVACSGPQSLEVAIQPEDEAAYEAMTEAAGGSSRVAFYRWAAAERGISVADARSADDALDGRHNPFNARRDPEAVSRGAVIYSHLCLDCHGAQCDGRGPGLAQYDAAADFRRFGRRFSITLHGGAPRSWFRAIDEGIPDPDVPGALLMPAFGDQLTREQIWLAVTYLQSLDRDAVASRRSSDS
jgi:mono/diheme cytochrome c family protein